MEGDGRVGGRRAFEQPAPALGRPLAVCVEYSAEAAAYLVESISSCRVVIWGTALERGEQLGNAAARAGLVLGRHPLPSKNYRTVPRRRKKRLVFAQE